MPEQRHRIQPELDTDLEDLALLLRNSPFAFCIVDAQARLVEANSAFCDLIGYARQDLAVGWGDLRLGIDPAVAGDVDCSLEARDGGRIDVQIRVQPLGRREGAACFVRQITQPGGLDVAFHLSRDAMYVLDEKGSVIEANPQFCRLLGYDALEIPGLHAESFDPSHRQPTDGGQRFTDVFETIYRRKDGTLFEVEVREAEIQRDGRKLTLASVNHLATPKHVEYTLRESERRLREVLEMAQLNAVVLNTAGKIVFCNRYLLRTTGYSAEEALGLDWFDLFSPAAMRDQLKSKYASWVSQGQIPPHLENDLLTRDGSVRHVVWDNTLLRSTGGAVTGAALMGRDVTDQRRLEEQFRQAQRLETVGRLAGGIAHDFNNLLTVINGYADTALSDMSSFDPLYGMLEEIRRAGDRAARLTRQLLAFSRRQILELKEIRVNDVVAETAPMLRRLIGEDVQLAVDLLPGAATIQADEGQLQQVIMNLAVNSRDAMPEGGKLTIRTSEMGIAEDNENNLTPGRYVVLAVADTGCGMNEEVRSHVFEPFFTTKPTGKGTGLGLATVYGIVKQSGGHVWFETGPGAGTTFFIAFPAATPQPAQTPEDSENRPGHIGNHVLIVEDQREVRVFTRMALERAGYRVIEAAHGGEALSIVRDLAARVDLVISDVVMPDIGGFRLAEEVNEVRPDLPFLFVTGYPDVAPESRDGRPVHMLQKPFTGQDLILKVRELLAAR